YRWSIQVLPTGCVERALRLESHGSIQGTLRKSDGSPAKNVRVQVVRILRDGTLASTYSLWKDTNSEGQFSILGVPAGEFVLGVNIRSAATAEEPWETTYDPGVTASATARVIRLEP